MGNNITFMGVVESKYPGGLWVSGEWHAPCPACGGEDRFFVTPNGWGTCRQCGFNESALMGERISDDLLNQFRQQQQDLEAQAERERAQKLSKISRLIPGWHTELSGHPLLEELHGMHVPQWMIDYHRFGLTGSDDGDFPLCYTLPYWRDGDRNKGLASLQFRRVQNAPDDPKSRYFFGKGLPNVPFYPLPLVEGRKVLIVLEGIKKAATMVYDPVWVYTFRGHPANVVAMPNGYYLSSAAHLLKGVLYVVWIQDPDTFERNPETGTSVVGRNIRFVRGIDPSISHVPLKLEDKLDDLYAGVDPANIRGSLQLAIDMAPMVIGNWTLKEDV